MVIIYLIIIIIKLTQSQTTTGISLSGNNLTFNLFLNGLFKLSANLNGYTTLFTPLTLTYNDLIEIEVISTGTAYNAIIGSVYYNKYQTSPNLTSYMTQLTPINSGNSWFCNGEYCKVIASGNLAYSQYGNTVAAQIDSNASWVWDMSNSNTNIIAIRIPAINLIHISLACDDNFSLIQAYDLANNLVINQSYNYNIFTNLYDFYIAGNLHDFSSFIFKCSNIGGGPSGLRVIIKDLSLKRTYGTDFSNWMCSDGVSGFQLPNYGKNNFSTFNGIFQRYPSIQCSFSSINYCKFTIRNP